MRESPWNTPWRWWFDHDGSERKQLSRFSLLFCSPHHLFTHIIFLHSSSLIWVGVHLPKESWQGSQPFMTQPLSCSGWHKHTNVLGTTGSYTKLKLYQSQSSVFTRDGTEHLTGSCSLPSVSGSLQLKQMKIPLLCLHGHPLNKLSQ